MHTYLLSAYSNRGIVLDLSVYACTCVHIYIHICIHTNIVTFYTATYIFHIKDAYTHTHVYIPTYTHTHNAAGLCLSAPSSTSRTHTHTHTHIHTSTQRSGAVLERAIFHIENSYQIPNVRVQGRVCRTNLPSNTGFRGFGSPQGIAACEVCVCEWCICVCVCIWVFRSNVASKTGFRGFGSPQEIVACKVCVCVCLSICVCVCIFVCLCMCRYEYTLSGLSVTIYFVRVV